MKKENNALMRILLVFLPPIGIAYVWIRNKTMSRKKKTIYTVIALIWTIIIAVMGSTEDVKDKTPKQTEKKQEKVEEKPKSDKELYGVDSVAITGDLLHTPAFTADSGTSKMVDQIALTAKTNAENLNDDQVNTIINDIRSANHNFYTDEATMLKYMWYGYLLDYKFEDSNARSSLGQDVYQAVKNIYRNTDTLESDATQANFRQIDKSIQEIAEESMTLGQKNAVAKAHSYLEFTAFSYSGLVEQLQYEGFTAEESTFAVDNCGADWNEQAAKKAQSYMEYQSFSRDGLIDQLLYEGFTQEQAEYGVTAIGY